MLPMIYYNDRRKPELAEDEGNIISHKEQKNILIFGSLLCGIFNWAGAMLVQVGLVYTAAGKTAFISSLYIILVPIIGICYKKKTTPMAWIGVGMGVLGLYFLSITDHFGIAKGDLIVASSCIFFAIHIHLIAFVVKKVDGIRFVRNEAVFSALWSLIFALVIERPDIHHVISAAAPLIFSGIFAVGVAYSLQVTAQKHTEPTIAALLMSLEALFGAVGGVFFLGERFTGRELAGGALVMAAVLIAQLPSDLLKKKESL